MDGAGFYLAVAVASLASAAGAAGGLQRLTRWSRAACWFFAPLLLVPCWSGAGMWAASELYTDDCSEWCTESWAAFLFGALAACVQLGISVLAGVAWLSGRRGSSARAVQPM